MGACAWTGDVYCGRQGCLCTMGPRTLESGQAREREREREIESYTRFGSSASSEMHSIFYVVGQTARLKKKENVSPSSAHKEGDGGTGARRPGKEAQDLVKNGFWDAIQHDTGHYPPLSRGAGQHAETVQSFFQDTLQRLRCSEEAGTTSRSWKVGDTDPKSSKVSEGRERRGCGDIEERAGEFGAIRSVRTVYDACSRKHILISQVVEGVVCPGCHQGKMTTCHTQAQTQGFCAHCHVCQRELGDGKHFACGGAGCENVELCYPCTLAFSFGRHHTIMKRGPKTVSRE